MVVSAVEPEWRTGHLLMYRSNHGLKANGHISTVRPSYMLPGRSAIEFTSGFTGCQSALLLLTARVVFCRYLLQFLFSSTFSRADRCSSRWKWTTGILHFMYSWWAGGRVGGRLVGRLDVGREDGWTGGRAGARGGGGGDTLKLGQGWSVCTTRKMRRRGEGGGGGGGGGNTQSISR